MQKQDLHGFVPAVVTPFNKAGDIMEDDFNEIVNWLIVQGATAICVSGDNGESWTLSPEERGQLTKLAVETSAGRVPIITGVSAPTLKTSLAYCHEAKENGAAAILAMPQTYVIKTTRDELLTRFEKLAFGCDLPIIAYNSPRRAGLSMSVDDIGAILNVAPIIGIKESQRDFFHHTHLVKRFADRMSIMVGPCHYILPAIGLGAKGFIATGPEFLGDITKRISQIATQSPNDEYKKLHYDLTVLYELLMGTATWPASFKAALNLIGLPAGVPREPVNIATPADIDKIKKCFDSLNISYQ